MPRAFYESTIGKPDAAGVWSVLSNVKVTVYDRGTTNLVTVYQRETGVAEGPSPEAGAVGTTNPFTTGASGSVQFWANAPARYDIKIEDNVVPSRISTRTIQWNAIPLDGIPGANVVGTPDAYASGIPGGSLVAGSLTFDKLAATALDYFAPIGTMLDYGGVSDPPKNGANSIWLVADGRAMASATFPALSALLGSTWDTFDGQASPGAGSFRLPKTGARVAIPTGVSTGQTTRSRGQMGGEELHTQTPAEAAMKAHAHSISDPGHAHSIADPGHAHQSLVKTVVGTVAGQAGGAAVPRWEWEGWTGTTASGTGIGIYGAGTGISIANTAAANGAAANVMQPWVCLGAKIIRVL